MAGIHRFHAAFDLLVNVFQDDDGVIDNESCCENDTEECENVDREIRQIHDEECTDQRDGNGDDGNEGCAPVTEKEENNKHNQCERNEDRLFNFDDGLSNRLRHVHRRLDDQVGWEVFLDLCDALVDFIRNGDVIGPRLRSNDHADHRHAANPSHDGSFVLFPENRISDIFEPYHTPAILLDDERIEFAGFFQSTERSDRQLGSVSFDPAGGEFDILSVQGADDIRGRQAKRCKT